MNNLKNLKFIGLMNALFGLLWTLDNHSFGPIMMTFGIIIATFAIFKDKDQNNMAVSIIAATLALMLILEYFLMPLQNTLFYVLLLIMSIGTFLVFHFSLKPQNLLTKREKIVSWTGTILFSISLFILMGIIYSNFALSLIIGTFTLIIIIISQLIRRRKLKDNKLKTELS